MKTICTHRIFFSLVVLGLIALMILAFFREDKDLRDAKEGIRQLMDKPDEIVLETKMKEVIQSLGKSERRNIREYMANQALLATNFESRLTVMNNIVDATIWTNGYERNLEDDDLACTLRQIYEQDSRKAIRRRALSALLRRESPTNADVEWVRRLVRSGHWELLPLAIRFGDQQLKGYVKEIIDELPVKESQTNYQRIRIIPSIYVADSIESQDFGRLEKMKLRNFALVQEVYLEDILLAYLASIGETEAKARLLRNYEEASAPVEIRKPEHKDKLYWYSLLCLTGELPNSLPDSNGPDHE